MRAFAYERPTDLADALGLLADQGSDARLLAGGTDLIIRIRDGSIQPRTVVDIKGVAELERGHPRSRRLSLDRCADRHDRPVARRADPA